MQAETFPPHLKVNEISCDISKNFENYLFLCPGSRLNNLNDSRYYLSLSTYSNDASISQWTKTSASSRVT